MNEAGRNPTVDLTFPHRWQAEILPARPLILPGRHFVYPAQAEEVEREALEVLIRPDPRGISAGAQFEQKRSVSTPEFLATCALGFRDPAVPTGIWSCPNPDEICAVSGGYAYVIDATDPSRFTMVPYRPVLQVLPVPAEALLLFVSHHAILAWGVGGKEWQSEKLSDEGVSITSIENGQLHGQGWSMLTDKETPFSLELSTGLKVNPRG
jgi:hypothetical protein